MHSAEVNRLHKVLDDGSIKLGGVIAFICREAKQVETKNTSCGR